MKGARRTSQNDSPVNDVVLHPNQAEIISVCRNGTVRIWDLAENKIRKTLGGGKISSLQTASIMGDGSVLVAADQSGQIHVWDAAHDYKYLRSFQAHKGYVLKSLFSPNLKYLATTSSDTTVKIWSTKDLKFKCTLCSIVEFENVTFSCFCYVTQITRISLVSLTHVASISLESQRSNAYSIMTKT